jgi:V-type H+-transporting ATPase subunit a
VQENEKDSPECNQYMYAGQHVIQRLLLLSALVCIPWMLFAKPFVLKREAAAKPGQHFDFVEVMIHQGTDRGCVVLSDSLVFWAPGS